MSSYLLIYGRNRDGLFHWGRPREKYRPSPGNQLRAANGRLQSLFTIQDVTPIALTPIAFLPFQNCIDNI